MSDIASKGTKVGSWGIKNVSYYKEVLQRATVHQQIYTYTSLVLNVTEVGN